MLLCLKTLGDTVVMSPTAPQNAASAIDSTMEPLGPIYLDHNSTVGSGHMNMNVLAQTENLSLVTSTGIDLNVRANTVVVAGTYGLADDLDLSVVLPIIEETIDAHVHIGPLVGGAAFEFAGASDLIARLKYRLTPTLSVTLKALFPTGNSAVGLGTGDYWLSPGLDYSQVLGPVQLNGHVAFDTNLSKAAKSAVSYGLGAATLIQPWLGVALEFLGSSDVDETVPLPILGFDYAQRNDFALVLGLRVCMPHGIMAFAAGSYALNPSGLRADGVFPTVGMGVNF